eukprot:6481521-Amphidinium_carterae.1
MALMPGWVDSVGMDNLSDSLAALQAVFEGNIVDKAKLLVSTLNFGTEMQIPCCITLLEEAKKFATNTVDCSGEGKIGKYVRSAPISFKSGMKQLDQTVAETPQWRLNRSAEDLKFFCTHAQSSKNKTIRLLKFFRRQPSCIRTRWVWLLPCDSVQGSELV